MIKTVSKTLSSFVHKKKANFSVSENMTDSEALIEVFAEQFENLVEHWDKKDEYTLNPVTVYLTNERPIAWFDNERVQGYARNAK